MWGQVQLKCTDRQSFLQDARDYALLNGLVMRSSHLPNDNSVVHLPFTLFPSPFPRKKYEECLSIHPTISLLMCKIANDTDFMQETLKPIAQKDEFTSNLLNINSIVLREGLAQPIISCINRSDYMLDRNFGSLRIRQVEVNAIASSMSSPSCRLDQLHKYLYKKYNISLPSGSTIPENNSLHTVTQGIIDIFDSYGKTSAYVLLLSEERSLNFSDHVSIELVIHKRRPDIRFVRRSFVDLQGKCYLGPNKELLLEDSKEIALVYFRSGYDPSDYSSQESWDLRLLLERSRAIKCPSINFHLSGVKKFQHVLQSTKQLERYLDTADAERLANLFCKFWSVDTFEQDQTVRNNTNRLVLKPQREGGGHNIFGEQIKPFLDKILDPVVRLQYILMEYIDSPREYNWLIMQNESDEDDKLVTPDKLVSELGIYGNIIANGNDVISNSSSGYLVRSKRFGVKEGGVTLGYAGISNILLIDDDHIKSNNDLFYEE